MSRLLLISLLLLTTTSHAKEYNLDFKRTEKNLIVSGEFKELKWFLIRWQDEHWDHGNDDHIVYWTANKHVLRLMDHWLDEAKSRGFLIFDVNCDVNREVMEKVLLSRYGENTI